jgi:hypothetical protein
LLSGIYQHANLPSCQSANMPICRHVNLPSPVSPPGVRGKRRVHRRDGRVRVRRGARLRRCGLWAVRRLSPLDLDLGLGRNSNSNRRKRCAAASLPPRGPTRRRGHGADNVHAHVSRGRGGGAWGSRVVGSILGWVAVLPYVFNLSFVLPFSLSLSVALVSVCLV